MIARDRGSAVKRYSCRLYEVVLVAALILSVTKGWAFFPPSRPPLLNIDRRGQTESNTGTVTAEQKAAAAELRAQLPGARVDFDVITGAPAMVSAGDTLLTGNQGQGPAITPAALARVPADDPHRATKAFLAQHRKLFGFGSEALDQARLKRDFVSPHNGLRTAVWEQQVKGIPVFEGVLISHTTKDGALVNLSSRFVRDAAQAVSRGAPSQSAFATPAIAAAEATALAAQNIGENAAAQGLTAVGEPAASPEKHQKFKAAFLLGESKAKLTWLALESDKLRLCWDVILTSRARSEMFRVLVDAQAGEVLVRHCLTEYLSDATYNVFTSDSPSPLSPGHSTPQSTQPAPVGRILVTLPALSTNASPNGWIDDGGNETLGNNVDAHTDRDDDDLPDLPRPQGSPFRVFNSTMDLTTQDPTNYSQAAVVQLFYWNNWMHDKLYELGFTEAAGNFQNDNFGRGGLGNDAVQADAQDGRGTDNANFSTPPDGAPGRMQMYIFTRPNPRRDGDLDAEVVLHEYAHGLSNRRVGGGVGISALQAEGMGEGWSDFYPMALLSEPGDSVNGCYASGAYVSYLLSTGFTTNYYFGIRRYPYTTDMTRNPLTFKDIDPAQASTHTGIPRSPVIGNTANEVHNMGEVWCVTLWEARASLINKLGYAVGNQLILQLVTDGMNLSPANPTFLQARDAIIQADVVNTGGANRAELWAAFAKRGMGVSATSPASSTTTGLIEAFDVPDPFQILPATALSATGPLGGPFAPDPAWFTLTNAGASTLNWSLVNTAAWLTVTPSSGTLTPGGPAAGVSMAVGAAANGFALGAYPVTIRFTNHLTGVGQARSFNLNVVGRNLFDDFDPGLDLSQWSSFGGVLGSTVITTNYGRAASPPNSLWFSDAGSRFATTRPINTSGGGTVSFNLCLANGSAWPWEQADALPGEGVVLEYSTDSGATWTVMGSYDTTAYYLWTAVTLPIPASAQAPATQFRWRQKSHSGDLYDHWALDDVTVDAGPAPPSILTQPSNQTVPVGSNPSFAVVATGSAPLSYQWCFNGANLAGANINPLTLANVQSNQAGSYSVVVSNVCGSVTSAVASLTVLVSLGQVVNAPGLVWSTSGDAAWTSESSVSCDGVDAAQSGFLTDNQSGSVQTAVTGPGHLSFWWKVSSEEWFDYLTFCIDGLTQAAISGEVGWEQRAFTVGSGDHTLKWTYAKDVNMSAGADMAWLDQVTFITNPPVITLQPISQKGTMGTTIMLGAEATGAPPITYQWWKDGTNLGGSTSTSHVIANATRRDSGVYQVVASNPGGDTPSSNAMLVIRSPQKLGAPLRLPGGTLAITSDDADGGRLLPGDLAGFQALVSTNLLNWETLTNGFTLTNGLLLLRDADSTSSPTRFYRIIEP
jgi:hypothetical protein